MKTYKDKRMQDVYDLFMEDFKVNGRPIIGSKLSQAFRDGFDGNRLKADRSSLCRASYLAGKHSAIETLKQARAIDSALT